MPLGRPVVPDEYSIGVPSHSSAIGVSGMDGDGFGEVDVARIVERPHRIAAVDHQAALHPRAQRQRGARHRQPGRDVMSSCASLLSTM